MENNKNKSNMWKIIMKVDIMLKNSKYENTNINISTDEYKSSKNINENKKVIKTLVRIIYLIIVW